MKTEVINSVDVESVAYDLNINSSTNTEIVATLGGGHVGEYHIRVIK